MIKYNLLFRQSEEADSYIAFQSKFNKETGGDLKILTIHEPEEKDNYIYWNVSGVDKEYQLRYDGYKFALYEEKQK